MASFEIIGTVNNIQNLTSSKGNPYLTFCVTDGVGKKFELSLFGDSMAMADKLSGLVSVKGVLGSREYQDKNGKTRYGIELKPQWIEKVKAEGAVKSAIDTMQEDTFASIPF